MLAKRVKRAIYMRKIRHVLHKTRSEIDLGACLSRSIAGFHCQPIENKKQIRSIDKTQVQGNKRR